MSYFFSAINYSTSEMKNLDRLFSDCVKTSTKTEIVSANLAVSNYFQEKVIKDIVIKDNKSDSWLMLIGMPLLSPEAENDLQLWIDKFFQDYAKTIGDDIDGHFCLFAYDALRKVFIAATDFNNFIPIFYSSKNNRFVFSSSEVLLAKFLQSDIDPLGFSQGIHLGVTWDSTTRFQDIRKTNPCEIITVDEQHQMRSQRYWEPSDEKVWQDKFDVVLDRWMGLLGDAVQGFYNKATVKETVWTDLTGGEDARLLVAQCHALGLPYKARVGGFDATDIEVASRVAQESEIDLVVDPYCHISDDQVLTRYRDICLSTDGYGSFFYGSTRFATNERKRPLVFDYLHFSGVPGGEAFRGTYYTRAKLVFPSKTGAFDYRFFARLKYLLNYRSNLTSFADTEFLDATYASVRESLSKVDQFPVGLQVDHLLREFQTCVRGLYVKRPFYLPFGLKDMTASIYNVPPPFKRGGRLTKASTEKLFPRLAFAKTAHHIPTVRRSIKRFHLFLPEYYSFARKVATGFNRRVMHFKQSSKTLSAHHRVDIHAPTMMTVLNSKPLSDWFRSSSSMLTGQLYNKAAIDRELDQARQGKCNYVESLGRIINQELACRYIYDR